MKVHIERYNNSSHYDDIDTILEKGDVIWFFGNKKPFWFEEMKENIKEISIKIKETK